MANMTRWLAVSTLFLLLALLVPGAATAQQEEVEPYVMLLFDTSGSMRRRVCNEYGVNGDNSAECPGSDVPCSSCNTIGCGNSVPDDVRLFKVKKGAYSVVSAFGEVTFALSRFHQDPWEFTCPWGGWWGAAENCSGDKAGTGWNRADVLVGFSNDNQVEILRWMNNCDDYPSPGACPAGVNPGTATPKTGCSLCAACGGGCDMELRAEGFTPLAGSLRHFRTGFFPGVLSTDPKAACRPYKVIMLTDGQDTCPGDPVDEAKKIHAGVSYGGDTKSIPVHVIGFGDSTLATALNNIAKGGGTQQAIIVDNEVSLALAMASIISESILKEKCNNADDDCDNHCDETFPEVAVTNPACKNQHAAQTCTVGLGICKNTGTWKCKADQSGSECSVSPLPGKPSEICGNGLDDNCNGAIDEGCLPCAAQPEVCDGKDNDCDKLVDEDYTPVPCGSNIGECKQGTSSCSNGKVVCNGAKPPVDELCDNKDNNCDTVIDMFAEVCYPPGTGNGCDVAAGTCQGVCAVGSRLCANGSWGACFGHQGPSTETCNGLDDDCDGTVDEGVTNTCTDFATCTTYTSCSSCLATPAEVCDGKDNDCNGKIDDSPLLAGKPCGTAVGECQKGAWACENGGLVCKGKTGPWTEVCDGKDNDCDGVIDDNISGLGQICGTNVGECQAGTTKCIGGQITCSGEVKPATEICDNKDNDCNGAVDDNIPQALCGSDVGECQQGKTKCVAGKVVCSGATGPQAEICDGKDNNCNGIDDDYPIDEGTLCGTSVGECAPGVNKCLKGGLVCTGKLGPKTEVCDGKDNDCNGATDDGIPGAGAVCGTSVGECQQGSVACVQVMPVGWTLKCVGGVGPKSEICDLKDNDCDGKVDEEDPNLGKICGTNIGECKAGAFACESGQLVCKGSVGSTPEICDGKDNDCNGAIDDNVPGEGDTCGSSVGECKPGKKKCIGGKFVCVGETGPQKEICDGKDNDCDGKADDMAECPGASECVEGTCLLPCKPGEFSCPGGTTCKNGYCVTDTCSQVTCADTQRCVDGKCVEKCAGIKCASHEKCAPKTGQCVDDSCVTHGCPGGESCIDHRCVPNPCPPDRCPEGQMCIDGQCLDTCLNVTCPGGQLCVRGECVVDRCAGLTCPANHTCKDGKCVPDPCRVVSCGQGQICHDGKCLADPCRAARCPEGFECRVNHHGQADCEPTGEAIPKTSQMLASGAGGCACSTGAGGAPGSGPPIVALALLGFLFLYRRTQRGSSARGSERSVARTTQSARVFFRGRPCGARASQASAGAVVGATRRGLHGGLVLLALLLAACQQDPFAYIERPDAGPRPDGLGGQTDALAADGAKGAQKDTGGCQATDEICDGKDNDCNGKIDDVAPAKLAADASHCGACGNACVYPNAFGKCEGGACTLDTCAPGYFDNNKNWTDGCEYNCLITNGGVEECPPSQPDCACDNADNDCDGLVDEVFDKTSDPNNCGACGARCLYNHAEPKCVGGKCMMGDCEDGYVDLNADIQDGCEYGCPVWPTTAEVCNGKDDDCDKLVDEGTPGAGAPCDTGKPGACKAGTTQCQGGQTICVPLNSQGAEVCNGKDDDCDGQVDEDFDLATSTLDCGACGNVCTFTNGVPICDKGVCKLGVCVPGYKDLNAAPGDGCEHKCAVWPPGAEVCNGKDDDCDTQVDEGFDLQTNVAHCGACNKVCSYPHAGATCVKGQCQMGACAPGYHNINTLTSDGCEYSCFKSNGGVEICDNADNDCDGTIDDGFNLKTDPKNCGTCGNTCSFTSAAATCASGQCQMGACDAGFKDLDGLAATGCEYQCPVWPAVTGADGCDGTDNDCDGETDEDFTSGSCGSSDGECKPGTTKCVGGSEVCENKTGPTAEVCDNKDNDCDGETDEDFDKQNDPRYCGQSCTQCKIPHAIAKCQNGACAIAVCEVGWVNLDGAVGNGCEYKCTKTGVEICDGLDNDCDGKIDGADPGMSKPTGSICAALGECAGASATCQGSNGWVCSYGPDVEIAKCTTNADCQHVSCDTSLGVCPGELSLQETRCDDKDNNCNGLTDETFNDKGLPCAEKGKYGVCQGTGSRVCKADGTGTRCDITTPGQSKTNEICNGLDDDCDNKIDEEEDDAGGLGVVDAMVHISRSGFDFYIYRYEASRPDASSLAMGKLTSRACSRWNVIPWSNLTYDEALAACNAAGKRLCTAAEWYAACSGAPQNPPSCKTDPVPGCHYPYLTDTYDGKKCNGHDYHSGKDAVIPAGTAAGCISKDGVNDMSGNLREWTDDQQSTSPSAHTVRGGGYDNVWFGLQCDFAFAVMPDTFYYPNLGFRCCSDTPP
jgi:MYXO-CTERM domain-containing protein